MAEEQTGTGKRLLGRVAVVTLGRPELALRLAAEGATVVLVGDDAEQAGRLLSEIESGGTGRGAFFREGGDSVADLDALVELVAEQFRDRR
ncbi:MAG: hypothetical protein ACRD0Q_10965 [Acidimicrobiales bacterium]